MLLARHNACFVDIADVNLPHNQSFEHADNCRNPTSMRSAVLWQCIRKKAGNAVTCELPTADYKPCGLPESLKRQIFCFCRQVTNSDPKILCTGHGCVEHSRGSCSQPRTTSYVNTMESRHVLTKSRSDIAIAQTLAVVYTAVLRACLRGRSAVACISTVKLHRVMMRLTT